MQCCINVLKYSLEISYCWPALVPTRKRQHQMSSEGCQGKGLCASPIPLAATVPIMQQGDQTQPHHPSNPSSMVS